MSLGKHLILDIWGEKFSHPFWHMDDGAEVLKQAAIIAGATILTERWHHFGSGSGYTGVVILAESHISIHTWPENGYAGIDIFMCGNADPNLAVDFILDFFKPIRKNLIILNRGDN